MSDYRDLLEQERRRHAMPDGSLRGLQRRGDRKRRNGQILAGVLALLIAAAGIGGGLFALRSSTGPRPADRTPTPTPTAVPGGKAWPSRVSGPIQFIDDQHGWVVDVDGRLLATSDGGHSWSESYGGPSFIRAVDFADPQHGWALNDSGLLRTTDGGSKWEQILGPSLHSIQFLTAEVGWGVVIEGGDPPANAGRLLKTKDGGTTWIAEGQQLEVLSACFVTERFGWAAGPHEAGIALFWTADGGLNWTEVPIPLPGGDSTGWFATVRCAGNAAWVLGQGDGGAGHIAYAAFRMASGESGVEPVLQDAYTHPLGQENDIPEASNPYPGPFTAPDAQSARLLTWCDACDGDMPSVSLERTQDGGATWTDPTVLDSNRPAEPLGISFLDQDRGWILLRDLQTGSMIVLRTADGGETWEQP